MPYNPFPVNYYPNTYFPQPSAPQPQPPHNNGIVWVQGEAGAKSYLVTPNTTVPLWDSEDQIIYLKSADASGMPSIKVLDYTIRETVAKQPAISESSDYVTRSDLEKFREDIKREIREEVGA